MTLKNILKFKFPAIVLSVSLIVAIFLLFFSVSVSYRQYKAVIETEKWVVHSHKVTIELQNLISILKDAETGQRGYLLTRDTAFLQPYNGSFDKALTVFINLKKLIINNTTQKQNLDTLRYLIDKRLKILANVLLQNMDDTLLQQNIKTLLVNGKIKMDDIRLKTSQMEVIEAKLLQKREANYQKEITTSPLSYLVTSIISLIIFICAYYKIYKDIRHLKQANNQLLINKRLFEHSEHLSNICNWCWNLEANHLTFSNNIHHMLRCTQKDFEQTVDGFIKFVHPDDKHIITDGAKNVLSEFETSTVYYRVIRKDGELCYFTSSSKLIKDNYNKQIRIGVITDITQQHNNNKILEEKLFDLERSNKELSAFNHVASHDLREPLRKIQTFISRLKENEFESLTDTGKDYFLRTQAAANRMQLLITDLLAFSRANKADRAFELTDLNILLENSQQELSQIIEQKEAKIIANKLPIMHVIPFQIQQLFTNLLSNALKYGKENEPIMIKIIVDYNCDKNAVKQKYTTENKFCKISISDNGIGFEQEQAEAIFTLFNRLHSDKEYSGTGIGLTICKKIVENHKGFITAEGFPNIGGTFNIYLPA